jgi:uncharacterized protein (TIGR00375 family)
MNLEELDRWASDKGIQLMGTGDFTHPKWFKEIREKLEPAEQGFFKLKKKYKLENMKGKLADTRFLLSVEISSIYFKGGKCRRVHNIVFSPDIESAEKIIKKLLEIGNLASDGRPILGLDCEELAKIVFEANKNCVLIPAHAWTPWFSVFGSMSGFDSLKECFGKYTKNIFAIETGLSSDPPMNWRVSKLDDIALISNSDSHSLQRIGREANVFDCEFSYSGLMTAIKESAPARKGKDAGFLYTIEFFPEEGKYHIDGHLACGFSCFPSKTKKLKEICPKCGKKMTVGVLTRVEKLADRPEGFKDSKRVPFKNLFTLDSIIGEALDVGKASKSVKKEYEKLIKAFDSEFNILLNVSPEEVSAASLPEIGEGIKRMREGKIEVIPGFDGQFGVIKIFSDKEKESFSRRKKL